VRNSSMCASSSLTICDTWSSAATTDGDAKDALGRLTPIEFEDHHDQTCHSGDLTQHVTYTCSGPGGSISVGMASIMWNLCSKPGESSALS